MSRALKILSRLAFTMILAVFAILHAAPAAAQMPGTDIGAQNLQPYHFLFIAYALIWLLVFGWVVSIARRLARLEKRLQD